MKFHRFFINSDLQQKVLTLKDKSVVDQIRKVLRLRIGDKLIFCDGHKDEALAEIFDFKAGSADFKILGFNKNKNEPLRSVTLYCSILRRENFEWVVQKATEVGVRSIVPIIVKKTVKINLNQARLEKIAKEAAEQSGRGIIPKISDTLTSFREAAENAKYNQFNLLFDPSGKDMSEINIRLAESVGIWIGPEGGWDNKEISEAKVRGFGIINLGKLTFRAETAAVIASYFASSDLP